MENENILGTRVFGIPRKKGKEGKKTIIFQPIAVLVSEVYLSSWFMT